MWGVIVDLEQPIKEEKDICYDNNSSALYARRQWCTYVNARLKEVYVDVNFNQVFKGLLCGSGYVDKKRVTRLLLLIMRLNSFSSRVFTLGHQNLNCRAIWKFY
jgi:hypothetical protein